MIAANDTGLIAVAQAKAGATVQGFLECVEGVSVSATYG